MIEELIRVANSLDSKGLMTEADFLDNIINKISFEEKSSDLGTVTIQGVEYSEAGGHPCGRGYHNAAGTIIAQETDGERIMGKLSLEDLTTYSPDDCRRMGKQALPHMLKISDRALSILINNIVDSLSVQNIVLLRSAGKPSQFEWDGRIASERFGTNPTPFTMDVALKITEALRKDLAPQSAAFPSREDEGSEGGFLERWRSRGEEQKTAREDWWNDISDRTFLITFDFEPESELPAEHDVELEPELEPEESIWDEGGLLGPQPE